jgi:hypothetical protein
VIVTVPARGARATPLREQRSALPQGVAVSSFDTADRLSRHSRSIGDVRDRNAWSDTFVDALCDPPETFSFGGMFAHVITFNTYQRLLALDALRRFG